LKSRKNQRKTIEKIKLFNNDKTTNFTYIKYSLLEYIFKLKITAISSLKELDTYKFISLYSGKNKKSGMTPIS